MLHGPISKCLPLFPISIPFDVVAHLCESDIDGSFPKALAADIETVLADDTGVVCADAAVNNIQLALKSSSTPGKVCVKARRGRDCSGERGVPLPGALAVATRARKPDVLVRHDL